MAEQLMSEVLPIVATIDPDAYSTQTLTSDAWDMQKYRRVMVIMMSGTHTTAESAIATLTGSATSNGSFTTLLDKTASLLETSTGTNAQVIINLSAAEVASTAYRWAKLSVVASGATTVNLAAVVLGDRGRFTEAYTTIAYGDLASVISIVD